MEIIRRNLIFVTISIFTIGFCLAIAFDITPYLRGPNDLIFESRWPYYFINTIGKVWAPILVFTFICLFYVKIKPNIKNPKKEFGYLLLLVFFIFIFQISLVYFSRFGITVLFQRITNAGMNGYFSTAVRVENNQLFKDFSDNVEDFDQHARDHPPGSIIFLKGIIYSFENQKEITSLSSSIIRAPNNEDAKALWEKLTQPQRVAAVFSAFLFHFLGALVVIPIYYLSKIISNQNIAFRSAFIYGLIPSVSFFALKFDPFYAIFPITSFLLFMIGIKKKINIYNIFAGIVFGIGLFFTLSILPVIGIIFIFSLLKYFLEKNKFYIKSIFYFSVGILFIFSLLYLPGFNFVETFPHIIGNQSPRMYVPWLFFNPYDVFVYIGIPIALLFVIYTYKEGIRKRLKDNEGLLLYSFWVTFILLIISGISRGEVGRIWLPLMFLPIILVSDYITRKLKISEMKFLFILMLIFIQVVFMTEFWVPVW